ncbi:Anoctamin-7, partial [Borealophlyctis nickersoniae]
MDQRPLLGQPGEQGPGQGRRFHYPDRGESLQPEPESATTLEGDGGDYGFGIDHNNNYYDHSNNNNDNNNNYPYSEFSSSVHFLMSQQQQQPHPHFHPPPPPIPSEEGEESGYVGSLTSPSSQRGNRTSFRLERYFTQHTLEHATTPIDELLPPPELLPDPNRVGVFRVGIFRDVDGDGSGHGHGHGHGRKVILYREVDVKCWDAVREWRRMNPGKGKLDALEVFCKKYPHADAIITLQYGTPRFDYILKYKTDDGEEKQRLRDEYERMLLEAGLILEREPSVEVEDEAYTKVVAPFWVLCRMAQRYRLHLPVKTRGRAKSNPKLATDFAPAKAEWFAKQTRSRFAKQTGPCLRTSPADLYDLRSKSDHTYTSLHSPRQLTNPLPPPQAAKPTSSSNTTTTTPPSFWERLFGGRSTRNPIDSNTYNAAFRVADIGRFEGGDIKSLGLARVQLEFFRDAHRTLLAYQLVEYPARSVEARELDRVVDHHQPAQDQPGTQQGKKCKKKVVEHDDLHELLEEKAYKSAYNTHEPPYNPDGSPTLYTKLLTTWAKNSSWFRQSQPLDDIRAYFGEKLALYFAFFAFTNAMVMWACVGGLIVFAYGFVAAALSHDPSIDLTIPDETAPHSEILGFKGRRLFDNLLSPLFGFYICIWAVLFPHLWKRQERALSWRWGTSSFSFHEHRRAHYVGTVDRLNPVTHIKERFFPTYLRRLRQLSFLFIAIAWIGIIILSIYGEIVLETFLHHHDWNEVVLAIMVGVCSLVSILTIRQVYMVTAERWNEWENYKSDTNFEDAFILKLFLFDFFNNYSHPFYFAFLRRYFGELWFGEGAGCEVGRCSTALTIELFVIFIGEQLVERIMEIVLPYISASYKRFWSDKKFRRVSIHRAKGKGKTVADRDAERTVVELVEVHTE